MNVEFNPVQPLIDAVELLVYATKHHEHDVVRPDNIVLVMLRRIDEKLNRIDERLDRIEFDVHEIKIRVSSLEERMSSLDRRMDRLEDRARSSSRSMRRSK